MIFEKLTLKSVDVRPVRVPLKRPVVSKVGLFDHWPLILIDLHTEEGIVGHSYLSPISSARCATSSPPFTTWQRRARADR